MSVTYTEIKEGAEDLFVVANACFASVGRLCKSTDGTFLTGRYGSKIMPDSILYSAQCDKSLNKACLKAYGLFVKSLFPERINFEIILFDEKKHLAEAHNKSSIKYLMRWDIKTKGLGHVKMLVLTTFCRMVDEFSGVIKVWNDFYISNPDATDDQLLERFQEVHVEVYEKIHNYGYDFSCHGLMNFEPRVKKPNSYRRDYPYNPLTVEELRAKFLDESVSRVLTHFEK
jgi:hypothetical protein